jgi:hypothetical protein
MKNDLWKDKISNHHQLGGIELSVLDNGDGRGCRIAWFNTGSGLRFKVVIDRAMDIVDAFYNDKSLAWISHLGVSAPNPTVDYATNWLESFGGGLLTTCGLTHTGSGEKDEPGERGVHDRISQLPAMIESVIQPNLLKGIMEMSITGRMIQTTLFGPSLELKRTISAQLGSSIIKIKDEVTNLGNSDAPHMLLYHMNFGWPLVDNDTEILGDGTWKARGEELDKKIFCSDHNFRKCTYPSDDYKGDLSAVAFVDLNADANGICECGLRNSNIGLAVNVKYPKAQLPWMTQVQHFGKNEYLTAIEPCTAPPIGKTAAKEDNLLIQIKPQETRLYELEIIVSNSNP